MELCRFDELTPNTARGFDPWGAGEDTVFVVRNGAEIRIFRNSCPHQSRPLEWRKNKFLSADGRNIICFAHGAQFDRDSGLCIAGPCMNKSLVSLECTVDKNGVIVLVD